MRLLICMFLAVFLMTAGCGETAPEADPAAVPDTAAATSDHDGHADADHDAHDHGAGDPLPFIAIMQGLSADLAAFSHALWLEDYALMSERSASIASHPPTDPADTERFQQILGDEYEDFYDADHVVHEAAEELHLAVESRDLDAILTRLADVQRGCVACHSAFRDRLLSEGSTLSQRQQ